MASTIKESTTSPQAVGEILKTSGWTLAVAESCTGGLLSARITSVPGSSEYFLGGIVAYANSVKLNQIGVSSKTLDGMGAVSEKCAREMARGVRRMLSSDWGLSITGIAGPTGGTPKKPTGLAYICAAGPHEFIRSVRKKFSGDRSRIRKCCVNASLDLLMQSLAWLTQKDESS